jgi:hypothetical protein
MDVYYSRIAAIAAILAPGRYNAFWGVTLGQTTYWTVGPEYVGDAARRHEACHRQQFARDGTLGFVSRYAREWLAGLVRTRSLTQAYLQVSYEAEARAAEGA